MSTPPDKSIQPENTSSAAVVSALYIEALRRGQALWFHVASGSMRPLLQVNDAVRIEPVQAWSIAVGEIAAFETPEGLVIHRIIQHQQTRIGTQLLQMGDSGSGKTTLSLGCASIGCGLLGDDLLTLRQDEQHMVSAYSIFPEVSVRSASIQLWSTLSFLQTYPADKRDKRYCAIEAIRPGATNRSTKIHCIVFPFLTENRESTLIPLSKAKTLQALIQLCISREGMYPRTQEQLFRLCSLLAEQASGYQCMVARGDLSSPYLVCSLFTGASI